MEALIEHGGLFDFWTCDIHFENTDPRGRNGFYPSKAFKEVSTLIRSVHGPVPVHFIEKSGIEAIEEVPDPIVWAFIDGCHCRQCVESELAACADRVVEGGFILLHDCGEEYRGYAPDQPYHGDGLRPFETIESSLRFEADHPEWEHVTSTPPKPRGSKFFGGTRVLRKVSS